MKTQSEIDLATSKAISEAIRYEALRDAQEFESDKYWHYHDCAIAWHRLAESFMPESGRTIAAIVVKA